MKKILTVKRTNNILNPFFPVGMHKKRKDSIFSSVYGLLYSNRLMSCDIGRSMANQFGKTQKHCIKQVDRLFGNEKWDVDECLEILARNIVGMRKNIVVTLDWTEFCPTGHFLLFLNLVTKHGRATPLIWKSIDDRILKNNRTRIEMDLLEKLKIILPNETQVTVLADRGFSSTRLFDFIEHALGWKFVIRLRKNHYIEESTGEINKASDLMYKNGRTLVLKNVGLMKTKRYPVETVVLVKKRRAKDPWILASNIKNSGAELLDFYSKRFTCEENFRDLKDDRFGMGYKETKVSTEGRMDRMVLLNAYANMVLTLLGAAGEKVKYSAKLKANTAKKRTHSLFRQGREYVKGVLKEFVYRFRRALSKVLKFQATTKRKYAIL